MSQLTDTQTLNRLSLAIGAMVLGAIALVIIANVIG
jgi:hypothetical protein